VRAGEPSRTAEYMALFRALEGIRSPGDRLFVDPLARAFLSAPLRLVVAAASLGPVGELIRGFIDRRWPGARTSAVARTRFIDDRMSAAVSAGGQQVVVLGAGFDARAYRLPILRDRPVFEVDHPATQAKKRQLLERSVGTIPANVRLVPVDFENESVADSLAAAGYDHQQETVFLWEGVTNYLTGDAVDDTLRWCSESAPGSEVLFTYVHENVLRNPGAFLGMGRLFRRLAVDGERWTFGLDPAHLGTYLTQRGLLLLEDLGAADYRAEYYGAASAAMRGYEFYRIARAAVSEYVAQQGDGAAGPSGRRSSPMR
jgi:methyltransferase (TIGR00027 family)